MKLDINLICGTIYRYGPGSFIFGCQYCEGVFCTTREIADHIDNHFLTKLPENKNKPYQEVPMQTDIYCADENEIYSEEIPTESNKNNFKQNLQHTTNILVIENDEFYWPTLPSKEIFDDEFYWPSNEDCERNTLSIEDIAENTIGKAYQLVPFPDKKTAKFIWPSIPLSPILPKRQRRLTKLTRSEKLEKSSTPRACPICGKVVRHDSYRNHVLGQHSKTSNYQCSICGQPFILRKRLNEHIQKMHLPKPKVQKKVHKKELVCDQCGKKCKSYVTFYYHKRWEHSPIDERNCKCRYCDKTFRLPSTRLGHERAVHLGRQRKPRNRKNKEQKANIEKQEQVAQATAKNSENEMANYLIFHTTRLQDVVAIK